MNVFEERAKQLLIAKGKMDLIQTIVGDEVELEKKSDEELAGILGRLKGVLTKFSDERMTTLLQMGYGLKDGVRYSYGKVAKELGLSAERIRQLHAKALRILRHPSKRDELLNGVGDTTTVGLIRTEEYKLIDKTTTIAELSNKLMPTVKNTYKDVDLEELDMSVRSFVCLKRAGIETLKDLFTLYEKEGVEGFYKVRNLGNRSLQEVLTIMRKYGKVKEVSESSTESEASSQTELLTD